MRSHDRAIKACMSIEELSVHTGSESGKAHEDRMSRMAPLRALGIFRKKNSQKKHCLAVLRGESNKVFPGTVGGGNREYRSPPSTARSIYSQQPVYSPQQSPRGNSTRPSACRRETVAPAASAAGGRGAVGRGDSMSSNDVAADTPQGYQKKCVPWRIGWLEIYGTACDHSSKKGNVPPSTELNRWRANQNRVDCPRTPCM